MRDDFYTMTHDGEPGRTHHGPGDDVSVQPIVQTLWAYRRVMLAAMALVVVMFAAGALAAILLLPEDREGSLPFRLLFDGAAESRYAVGVTFSPTDIVAAPVLTEVYAQNNLRRFGSYDDFKASMFILGSNSELDLLAYEYQAKLADTRLTSGDRERLEEEFGRKSAALAMPAFSLTMRRPEHGMALPSTLIRKVLHDTLAVWARYVTERKGAGRFEVPLLSRNVIRREVIERQDYLLAVDSLRTAARRLIDSVEQLQSLPGAQVLRTGADQVSLAEVRVRLEDVMRFKLVPLLDLVRSAGISRNARELQLYVRNQLFQLRLEHARATTLIAALRDALDGYTSRRHGPAAPDGTSPAVAPPFFDRLMALSTAAGDQDYRRDLTNRIIRESQQLAQITREETFYTAMTASLASQTLLEEPVTSASITARMTVVVDDLQQASGAISAIYDELRAQNAASLYRVTGPITIRVQNTPSFRAIGLYFGLVMVVTFLTLPICCLLHKILRRRPVLSSVAVQTT